MAEIADTCIHQHTSTSVLQHTQHHTQEGFYNYDEEEWRLLRADNHITVFVLPNNVLRLCWRAQESNSLCFTVIKPE